MNPNFMNNKQLKAKIFEIYSQNFNWIREGYNTKFYEEFEYGIFCPLCMDFFTKEIQVSYYKDEKFVNEIITKNQVDKFYEKCIQKTVLLQRIFKELS